jgi:N-acetylglucosaminyldiphosphoundecaprenol N-acetyl-beta-D-mannosaminyltransferase
METRKLFGLDIYILSACQLLNDINARTGKIHIISGNAEVLKYPLQDKNIYRNFIGSENIIIPDGISVYYPMKLKNKKCKKIPGIEFMQLLLTGYQKTGKSVYFLGARQEVISKIINKFGMEYPHLNIAGYHHGYFDRNNCDDIISDIKQSKAFALFVALGTPAQENFIFKYMNELPCSVYMGVGGSFDVLSGTIKRSPQWLSNLGLEWLYRMILDPSKISRLWNNVLFTIKALLYG